MFWLSLCRVWSRTGPVPAWALAPQGTLLWPCRAFSAAEARQHRLFPTKPTGESARRNQIQLGSQIFEDGYAIRDVAIKSLDPLGGAPAVDELQRFNEVSIAACPPHTVLAGPVHVAGRLLSLSEGHWTRSHAGHPVGDA